MPTPTFLTGWEHGILDTGGGGGAVSEFNDASIVTSPVRSGARALRLNTAASDGYWVKNVEGSAPNVVVMRVFIRFATFPGADCQLVFIDPTSNAGIGYKFSTNQFCTIVAGAFGAGGGPTLATGTWYRIDAKFDISTATWTADGMVDGTELAQSSDGQAATTLGSYKLGWNASTPTADVYFDDFVVSHTAGDYPLGEGKVLAYSPNSVGTHNLDASPSNAFLTDIGGVETAIAASDSTSWQLLDDVPLSADESHIVIENDAGLTAAHYLEYAMADSSETADIWGVRGYVVLRQDAAANCQIEARLREGVSETTLFSGDINGTSRDYRGKTFATKPTGGAWLQSAFNSSTLRFGYTTDADGRIRVDALMLETAFGATPAGGGGGTSGGQRMLTLGVG